MTDEENKSNKSEPTVYKVDQFDAFLATIKGNAVGHWVQIARVLGVSRDTINRWRELPQAQKAIKDQIERIGDEMERVGQTDWRMWESKMKMLGVSPIEKAETDITSGGKPIMGGLANVPKDDGV